MRKKSNPEEPSATTAPGSAAEVIVLDDDHEVALAVGTLMRSVRLPCRIFHDPKVLLQDRAALDLCGCLILDLRMPMFSGLDVQARLEKMGYQIPIIFLSGHGDIPTALRAIRAGALDFLEKPFHDQALLDLVNKALRSRLSPPAPVHTKLRLTPRERDAAEGILRNETTAVTAKRLGISRRTLDVHRSRLLRRLNVRLTSEARPILSEVLGKRLAEPSVGRG